MNFIDRLRAGLNSGMAVAISEQKQAMATMLSTYQNQTPTYQQFNFENAVREGFKKNELIFACISLKADSAAIPRLLVKNRKNKKVLPDHPLRKLIEKPNPFMTEFDFFSITLIYLDLAGVCYWEKVRSRNGKVIEMWPLRPDWVRPIRDSKSFISEYLYSPPGLQPMAIPEKNILAFKLFDPSNMYQNLAPVQVAARMGDVDNSSTDFVKLFFEKGGTPPGLLTTKQKLIESQVEEIRRRWRERYGGFENWIDPVILDSDATFSKIGLTFEEMGFEFLDQRAEARICMCLRTPPILIGATIGLRASTYSNYEAARKAFWQDTLSPQYKRLADTLNRDLVEDFDPNVVLEWDFSDVPALQDDINARWKRATEAFARGAITVNKFNEETGGETIPNGDVFLRGLNTIEVGLDNVRPIEDLLATVQINPKASPTDPTVERITESLESDDDGIEAVSKGEETDDAPPPKGKPDAGKDTHRNAY